MPLTMGFLPIDDLLAAHGLRLSMQTNATLGMTMVEGSVLLQALLRSRGRKANTPLIFVEWGSGGSTELVSWLIISNQVPGLQAFSIESSVAWMTHMRERTPLLQMVR